MRPTIFWPDDERGSGLCYGWTEPIFCIAGVIQEISEAENTLASLEGQPQWLKLSVSCGGNPVILGRCWFDRRDYQYPTLELKGIEDYNVINYRRHAPASLRFYSLHTSKPAADASESQKARNAAYTASLEHDFTRPKPGARGLNSVVINQVCSLI
ncbi:hypothetical protein B0H19DRAFT_1103259 [Mycena capillaripes]|nr:hypothetical protein B0H19DRAFT_1103259 [Mycena capillaripes]